MVKVENNCSNHYFKTQARFILYIKISTRPFKIPWITFYLVPSKDVILHKPLSFLFLNFMRMNIKIEKNDYNSRCSYDRVSNKLINQNRIIPAFFVHIHQEYFVE